MKFLLLIGILQVLRAVSCMYLPDDETVNDIGYTNMMSLGSVDGKTYFVDNSHLNWTTSREVCRKNGMELATITSPEQFEFLESVYNITTFGDFYWIGARDSQELRALSWDRTNSEIDPFPPGVRFQHVESKYQFCAVYHYTGFTQIQYISSYLCSFESWQLGILCETQTES